jgi:two-component system, OmpR family, alkaline phosphatase synthesis response regulator PhoP
MATATLSATLNTPISELRLARVERILVIEADGALRKILRQLFFSEGYEVEIVSDGVDILEMLRQRAPAAVILDLPQPVSSDFDLCKKIAKSIPGLPLLILSASVNVGDKVRLLEMGADDYVTIPFNSMELVARLRALIRRATRVSQDDVYAFEDVTINSSRTEVTRGGETVVVTRMEFKTLEFLTKNSERTISRDELLDKVWGYQDYPCTRTVDNHMLRLRQKLEDDPSQPAHFLTIYGLGYKFVP